jgi:hypothetical protein
LGVGNREQGTSNRQAGEKDFMTLGTISPLLLRTDFRSLSAVPTLFVVP